MIFNLPSRGGSTSVLWLFLIACTSFTTISAAAADAGPPKAIRLQSRSFDRVVTLHWGFQDSSKAANSAKYEILRSGSLSGPWTRVAGPLAWPHWTDTSVSNGNVYHYEVQEVEPSGNRLVSNRVRTRPAAFRHDRDLLDSIQRSALDYAWFEANPVNGLVRDRTRTNSPASIAATGFALSGLIIGVERGWLSRTAVAERVLTTLRTFARPDAGLKSDLGHKGWFYHFLDMNTRRRVWKCELSSIDTALLLGGVLDARQFFNQPIPQESEIRTFANELIAGVDWNWMRNGGDTLTMGWHPEKGFIDSRWIGYNEAMILYLLGIGAERDPLPVSSWKAWTSTYQWANHEGFQLLVFPPLFGHQYSHCWIDFRGQLDEWNRDRGVSYFETSRRATLAQRAYAIRNPKRHAGYASDLWGFTACDGPGRDGYHSYSARGTPPPENEDGTIAPTAAGASVPFAPIECIEVLRTMHSRFREQIWTPYGFCDAFNLTARWWDSETLGIDQLPMLIMIENHRTGSTWRRIMAAPEIRRGLERAGFVATGAAKPGITRP